MKDVEMPRFKNESEEADWWASRDGRDYVQRKAEEARAEGKKFRGSPLLRKMIRQRSVQIALRVPRADLERAREIASRKGIGYQTLLKMLVHEGLEREAKAG